jgi:hypothetical protein
MTLHDEAFTAIAVAYATPDGEDQTVLEDQQEDLSFYGEAVRLARRQVVHVRSIALFREEDRGLAFIRQLATAHEHETQLASEPDISLGWVRFYAQEKGAREDLLAWGPPQLLAWTDKGYVLMIAMPDSVDRDYGYLNLDVDSLHPELRATLLAIRGPMNPAGFIPARGWTNEQTRMTYTLLAERNPQAFHPVSAVLDRCGTIFEAEEALRQHLWAHLHELFYPHRFVDSAPAFAVLQSLCRQQLELVDFLQVAQGLRETLQLEIPD